MIQAIRKKKPFMAFLKEVYFIFDIHLPKPEVFCKLFEDTQVYISVSDSNIFSPRTKISLLSILCYEVLYKRRLFGYAILIHENKKRKFLLSLSTKHYSSIYEKNDMYGDLKYETFASI